MLVSNESLHWVFGPKLCDTNATCARGLRPLRYVDKYRSIVLDDLHMRRTRYFDSTDILFKIGRQNVYSCDNGSVFFSGAYTTSLEAFRHPLSIGLKICSN